MKQDAHPFCCLWIEMSGEFDLDAAVAAAQARAAAFPRSLRRCLLFDARELRLETSMSEIAGLASRIGEMHALKGTCAAFVSKDDRLVELFVHLAKEDGRTYEVFQDIGEAVQWLRKMEIA